MLLRIQYLHLKNNILEEQQVLNPINSNIFSLNECKVKVKSLPGSFSTLRPRGPIVFLPQQVTTFISRGTTHHTDARDLYQRRRELPPNFAGGSEFTRIPLGFFTCRKAGTWDILFYFPSEGRHTEDFSDLNECCITLIYMRTIQGVHVYPRLLNLRQY
jgi:hypothetical protein